MRFRKLKKWSNLKDSEGLLFFAQRMEELLFDYTLDSHKPLALNAPFLCREALLLISDIENGLIDPNNLDHVVKELEWSIQNDKVAKSLLDSTLERYLFKNDGNTSLNDNRIKLEVLSKTLNPLRYFDRCNQFLEAAVCNSQKKDINILAKTLVTTLINMNISKNHLYNETINYFYIGTSPTIQSNKNIYDFLDKLQPRGHDFNIFFICSKLIGTVSESIKPFKIKILDEIPADLKQFSIDKKFKKTKEEYYIEVEGIHCGDAYTAREKAERRLNDLRDLFTLFTHKQQINWKPYTLIKQCCLTDPVIVDSPKHSMEKGFDMKPATASKQLNLLLKGISLKGGSFEKFNRAVDFHGIGISTDIPENQLISIWIAIETIVPTNSSSSKINKIIELILPFILLNYIKRLIEKHTADLYLWNKYKISKLLKNIPNAKKMSTYQKVFHLLALDDNSLVLDDLYVELGDFHLLRFRTFQLSEILKNPKKINELIGSHKKKVSWQVRRLYRTRNIVVHSGRSPDYIYALIENGHDYLDQIMFEIIKMTTGNFKVATFEQAFELMKLKFEVLEKKIKSKDVMDSNFIDLLLRDHWGVPPL